MQQLASTGDLSESARACVLAALDGLSDTRFAELTLNANRSALQEFSNARCVAAGAGR